MPHITDTETQMELQRSFMGNTLELRKESYGMLKEKWLQVATDPKYVKGNKTCAYVVKMFGKLGAFEQAWMVPQVLKRRLDTNIAGALLRSYAERGSVAGLVRVRVEMAANQLSLLAVKNGDRLIAQFLQKSNAPLSAFMSLLGLVSMGNTQTRTDIYKFALSSCRSASDISKLLTRCEEEGVPVDEMHPHILRSCSKFGGLTVAKKWSLPDQHHREQLLLVHISAGSFAEPTEYFMNASTKERARLAMLYIRTCRHVVTAPNDIHTAFAEKIFSLARDIPSDKTLSTWVYLMNIYFKTRSVDAAEALFVLHLEKYSLPAQPMMEAFKLVCEVSTEGSNGMFGTKAADDADLEMWRGRPFPPAI